MNPLNIRDPGRQECQKNPIFLLQKRVYTVVRIPSWLGYDGDYYWFEVNHEDEIPEEAKAFQEEGEINEDKLHKFLTTYNEYGDGICCVEEWVPNSSACVWYSRAEAEKFATDSSHSFPQGWRVYCVSSAGLLSDILNKVSAIK